MLALPLALALAAAPDRWAVVAEAAPGDDPTAALAAGAGLAQSIAAKGRAVVTGSDLWEAFGEVREVGGEVPAEAERLLKEVRDDFDDGLFTRAAELAREADARLAAAPRSVAVEAGERQAQLFWGFTLADTAEGEATRDDAAHLEWAVARDPAIAVDAKLIPRGSRARLDEVRAGLRAASKAALSVTGTPGASVYLDGVLQGEAPLALGGLTPRRAWVWLERAGRHSLAHRVELGPKPASVAIDLDLEARLSISSDGQPVLRAPPGDPETPRLLERLAAHLHVGAAAAISRGPAGGWTVDVAGGGRTAVSRGGASGYGGLADDLLGSPPPEARPAAALAVEAPAPAPVIARPRPAWPWIVGGAALAAAGAGVALYFALRSAPDATFSLQQGGL
ncbi:MAG: hypothetical protein ACYDCL_15795 [Myxococcales bacterium]